MIPAPHNQVVWSPGVSLESMIQSAVEGAMVFYKGNKTAASQSLGIAIRTLDARLDKYKKEKDQHETRITEANDKRAEFRARQRAIPGGAQWDNSGSPSIHDAEVKRRRDAIKAEHEAAKSKYGEKTRDVPEGRVQPKPAVVASAK